MLRLDCFQRRLGVRRPGCAFAIRSLLVFVAVGVVVHLTIEARLTAHFREQVDFHATFVATNLVDPLLATDPSPATLAPHLEAMALRDDQVAELEVLGPDGRARAGTAVALLDQADQIVTTVPLSPGGDVVRVVQDGRPSARAAMALTRTIDVLLAVGLLALWAILLPLASRLGRDLRRRTDELEQQHAEVHRLLGREQETVARLQELSEMKDHFLSAVSHELRTPLTIVKGAVDTLATRGRQVTEEQRGQLLSRASRSAGKLETLLVGLLDLNRAADRRPQDHVEVDLDAVVTDVLEHLPDREVRTRLDEPTVVGDAMQVERILANLLGNAVRHAPGSHPVEMSSRHDRGMVEITVADRGPGVPDDLKLAIFEPFRQGDIADRHSPGTGIGLSLVARFAEAHGGRAWVCDRPGGGAEFHVRLPAPPRRPLPTAGAASPLLTA